MSYIARTINLTKVYEGTEVVSGVNMNIKQGEIYGFLGPNGAGKTTLMKMLTNLVKPTAGEIELFGEKLNPDSYELLKRMGSIIEYPFFYDKLSAWENLDLHCEYMGFTSKQMIGKHMEMVGLKDAGRKPVKDFSLGMKQRLGLARALITTPELLILDEPINGLDPVGIKEMRDLFKRLSTEYRITMLISSHILGEVEQVADTVGIIREGRLVEEVSMESIRGSHTDYIEVQAADPKKAAYVVEHLLHLSNYKLFDEQTLRVYDSDITASDLNSKLVQHGVAVESISKRSHSLEEHFMGLMKGADDVA
ncbi:MULTISPECIES: ABC transporter ATP-binding protein [Paenibacillus]|uniref:ABC transporter ATP-binding protein n=1 Tax=Paenibacillus cucumis (ex Kampfer et al. 2016) TaxID=1776858 RepID=A0ABS7KSM2_9BACL|nr:ABC transporter ATP-binding protein [Paenibacillus cucumis (ex Kampfer et al. 2016)]MBY0207006.1 ABC transporter ATP-binding protein [Paenibacillus cucumis (ex Kampfer et al. 2016)]